MKLLRWFMSVVCLLAIIFLGIKWVTSCSRIQTITSFEQVNFEQIPQDSLVVFDVDETLVQPTDAFLINEKSGEAEALRKEFFVKYPEVKNWNDISSIMLLEANRPLIEPIVLAKIKTLKEKGISFIACTAMNTGKYGTLPTMEQWRYEHLKSLGFEGSYADSIQKLPSEHKNPVFYRGILATDLEQKGVALGAFLDSMRLNPKNIIMFDDTLEFLHDVERECAKRGICFTGYHYTAAIEKKWNQDLAREQIDHLIKHKKWLSDDVLVSVMG